MIVNKILILEDDNSRIFWFSKEFKEYDVYVTKYVEGAIKYIEEGHEFEYVFIDHDLDGRIFVNSEEENTGYQFAKYISENSLKFDNIIIHSMNPYGASNIYNILQNNYNISLERVPFPLLKARREKNK